MPLWLRRNVAKYNALHPNDEPDSVLINADPPLRKATIKSYNPVTKQAIFAFSDSDKTVDVVNFEDFDTSFNDPENVLPSSTTTALKSTTNQDPAVAPEHTSTQNTSPQVDPKTIDSLDDNGLEELLRDCFHCGMADYTANPHGNPFSEHILTDVTTPLVEY